MPFGSLAPGSLKGQRSSTATFREKEMNLRCSLVPCVGMLAPAGTHHTLKNIVGRVLKNLDNSHHPSSNFGFTLGKMMSSYLGDIQMSMSQILINTAPDLSMEL